MEKANLLMEKASHGPRNVVQIFIVMGALTALHTALQSLCNIDHVYMYYSHFLLTVLLFSFL